MKTKLIYAIAVISSLVAVPSSLATNGDISNGLLCNGAVHAPDGGSTALLLGIALTGLVAIVRKRMGKSS
jgi:hypothetical protein